MCLYCRALLVFGVVWLASHVPLRAQSNIQVGSKDFTENIILAELAALVMRDAGLDALHRGQLGGTQIVWDALLRREIDIYPEYTGTLLQETLARYNLSDDKSLVAILDSLGLRLTSPLGFNNTYALGMRRDKADSLGISRISELEAYPSLRFGFSNEFMDRADGWPSLQRTYRLPQQNVQGLSHDLSYRGIASGALDVKDLYSTDAEIAYYDLVALDDDADYFPRYDALFLYRADLIDRAPAAVAALEKLAGRIDESTMVALNARTRIHGVPEAQVAADFLAEQGLLLSQVKITQATRAERIWQRTTEHLWLVVVSLAVAILVAIPLGIWAARDRRSGPIILGIVGVVYTIPSLALLVIMIPLLGIGGPPAMVALFLYSLLPIVRNTHTGLTTLPSHITTSAAALGLAPVYQLWQVELPMAMPAILGGIKTAAVINIGTATLGALIGAGGYGQPILTGIRLDDAALILEGAVPAALLALLAQGLFSLAERSLVPQGLRV